MNYPSIAAQIDVYKRQGLAGLFHRRLRNSFQRVVQPQLLILDFAHRMIRQNVNRFDIVQRT